MANALRLLKLLNGLDNYDLSLVWNDQVWTPAAPFFRIPGRGVDNGPPCETPKTQVGSCSPNCGATSTPGGGSETATTSSTAAASPFVINISWDPSVASAPAGFTKAVLAAVQYLESRFTNPVTINISVGWGEVDGLPLNGALGSSQTYLCSYTYSTIRSALAANATSSYNQSAVASLPNSAPVTGDFWTSAAEAKALGLLAGNGTSTDGFIGFSNTLPFTFDDSHGVAPGSYDFNGVALHELTEVMGRMLLTGDLITGSGQPGYDVLDLLHYSAPDTRDFQSSVAGYVSFDSGVTDLGSFNTDSRGDAGDWATSMGNNSFDAFQSPGVVNPVTTNDLRVMDIIGWDSFGGSVAAGSPGSVTPADIVLYGDNTVPVSTLTSALGAVTPSYVYGPSGGVDYLVPSATSASATSATDIIANFDSATDSIDLTSVGVSLSVVGQLGDFAQSLAAGSIGWQTSSDETCVYVNTSSGTESLASTDMKIQLLGSSSLSSTNFIHL